MVPATRLAGVSLELRLAAPADLDAGTLYRILQLRVDVFVVEQQCPYPELDGRDTEPGTVHLWSADDDGAVLATIRVLENGADRAIGRVATAASARGRGLSARLVRRGIELCAGRTVDIGAQAYLESWYERFGFRRSGPDYLEDGIPHLPMRLAGSVTAGQ
jgi:ElaA protein